MIKVYFDNKPLKTGHAVRGVGYYTKNLLEYLQLDKNVKLVETLEDAHIVHFPYFDLFFNTLKPISGKKNVVTIYDVIPLLYPKHYPPGIKGKINFFKQKRALRNIDAVLTISETSKKDIVRFLDVPADKIHVIHLAARDDFKKLVIGNWQQEIANSYRLPRQFVLYVGDVNYNKNLTALAGACKKIKVPLVIVGKQAIETNIDKSHPENKSFVEFLDKYSSDSDVLRLGFVETDDLVKIYNLATVYCQPSLYEGFGLPILEAQACGTPVLASHIQVFKEISQESCLYFDSKDANSIAKTLKEVMDNDTLKHDLINRGLENAKQYSWKKTASKTIEIYKKLCDK